MEPIIDSILDTDLYKISMGQCVFHQFPNANVEYVFKCRNEGVKLGFLEEQIREQVNAMANIQLTQDEEVYLRNNLSFLSHDYIEYLRNYRFNPSDVVVANIDGELRLRIIGTWVKTILWEVPLLAIINGLYFRETTDFKSIEGNGIRNLKDKMNLIRQYPTLTIAEFGTRRRYSREWQKYVLKELIVNCPQVVGTSNVKLAMELGIKPIGTMAHEYFSALLALVDRLETSQKRALHVWLQEYGTNLGIALTDTFTVDAFLKDFDIVLAREFAGVRHDSGDPIVFGKKIIEHYQELGIDPKTKTIVFSDGLDVPEAIRIYKEFVGKIGVSFGIGTNLTNDLGATPLNIVIKLIECNGHPVVKLSDNPGKAIGDPEMIEKVKEAYRVK
jgi:nicotinate phosphoribosyltransferase